MQKAVLFDMDGVLFDSMPNHAYAWSHAMTEFGLAMTPEEVYMNEEDYEILVELIHNKKNVHKFHNLLDYP